MRIPETFWGPTSRNFPPTCTIAFLCLLLVGQELIPRCVFASSGLGKAREQSVATSFSAEVSAPLSCMLSSLTNFSKSSGESFGKDTRHAAHMSFTQPMPDVFTCVELVSRASYINRKRRNWETRQRQSKAYNRAEREAKRKLMVQPEICHEAAKQMLRSQATCADDNFFGAIHVSHQLALLQSHANVFFC